MESPNTVVAKPEGVKKRKNGEEQILKPDYDVSLLYVKTTENVSKSEMVKAVVDAAISAHHSGLLQGHKDIQRITVCGPEKAGKSSLFNAMTSEFAGRDLCISPSATTKCTTCPLDMSVVCDGVTDFQLRINNKDVPVSSDADVLARLKTHYATIDPPKYRLQDAVSLRIKGNMSFRCVDIPGPRVEGDVTFADYFRMITETDTNGRPVLVMAICGKPADPAGNGVLKALKDAIMEDPTLWVGATLYLAITMADKVVKKRLQEELVRNTEKLLNDWQKYVAHIVTLKVAIVQAVCENPQGAALTREEEMKLLSNDKTLSNAKTNDGNPMFILGVANLNRHLLDDLSGSVVSDLPFLEGLDHALQQRIKTHTKQLEIAHGFKSFCTIGSEIVKEITNFGEAAQRRVDHSAFLRKIVREIIEERYRNYWSHQDLDPKITQSTYGNAQTPSGVPAGKADQIWQMVMLDFIETLSRETDRIINPLIRKFSISMQNRIEPFQDVFQTVHTALLLCLEKFSRENVPRLHEGVKTIFERRKKFLEFFPEKDLGALRHNWPAESKFIKDAKLENTKDKESLVRRILKTTVPMCQQLVDQLVIEAWIFEENLCKSIERELYPSTSPIEETSDEKKKEIAKQLANCHLVRQYVSYFIKALPEPSKPIKIEEEEQNSRPQKKAKAGVFTTISATLFGTKE